MIEQIHKWLLRSGWLILTLMSLYLVAITTLYYSLRTDIGFLLAKQDKVHDTLWMTAFYVHITGSILALMTGPFQFIPSLRNRYLKLHRQMGSVYVYSILLLGVPSGFYMAFFANGGFWAASGFVTLSFLWLVSTYLAYYFILEKKIRQHQAWMVRSFALTFSAVTLRTWVPLLSFSTYLDHSLIIALTAWINWIPNLILAEILLRYFYKKI